MKIDQNYLKTLLEACQATEQPTFNIEDLHVAGIDHKNPQFEFHMKILTDQNFVERDDGEDGFGLYKTIDGLNSWALMPLRLTGTGHEFIEALENKEVWETIKRDFKGASLGTLKTVSMQLLDGYVKKKISNILD
ncbi:DUF2513 domain-containing protein [Janthinobacterium sp. HSC-3S05]|uniref:DUF2513 domain-containing protein n=1 Tax=Janthinobacterium lividum TaxID=29581 RepID=UPI001CD8D084|nr:DUF2513 domain-containing protein [Janthinobacterium lividum]MCA1859299.1 DUF2513 domain-containing protein [Janthinobacterium lividum]